MKNTILILLIACSSLVTAQNERGSGRFSDGFKITRDQKGTPFLLDEWVLGYGLKADSTLTTPMLLNYDIHQNNFTYKTGEGPTNIMVITNDYLGFVLKAEGKSDMAFVKFDGSQFDKARKVSKYYLIAKAPSKMVIIEQIKDLEDPNSSGWASASTNNKSAEYKYKEKLYILNQQGKYVEVRSTKSSILKLFSDKKNKVSDFISSRNLDLNHPEDLVQVAEYYYSIQ